jgi:DNA-binding NarL/FixJ family response regulator
MPDKTGVDPDGAAPQILLVEDNPLHVRLVTTMLDEIWPDYENLAQARRLDSALEHLESNGADCVLLDLVLPDADGLEAVNAILAAHPHIPVVVLSSHDDDAYAVQALREGAQDYLVKGTIDSSDLARAIRFAINRHHLEPSIDMSDVIPMRIAAPLPEEDEPDYAGSAIIDRNGIVRFCEQEVAEMMGRTVGELVGRPLVEISHPDDLPTWRDTFTALAADHSEGNGDGRALSARVRHGSGHDQRVRVDLTPLIGATDGVEAFLARYYPTMEEGTASSGGTYVVMSGWNG